MADNNNIRFVPIANTFSVKPNPEYVCWVDIMGTSNTMSESFEKAANFILRLHSAVVDAIASNERIKYYPMMDGIYLASPEWNSLKKALKDIYSSLASVLIHETKNVHRFLIRGAVAYGDIFHGCNIDENMCQNVANQADYKKTLMFGMPMIQAYKSEHYAPPFGLYIHESARKVKQLQGRFFVWTDRNIDIGILMEKIESYLNWCNNYHNYLEMDPVKIELYKQLNKEHLSNMNRVDDKK